MTITAYAQTVATGTPEEKPVWMVSCFHECHIDYDNNKDSDADGTAPKSAYGDEKAAPDSSYRIILEPTSFSVAQENPSDNFEPVTSRAPLTWFNPHSLSDGELNALYKFMRSLSDTASSTAQSGV